MLDSDPESTHTTASVSNHSDSPAFQRNLAVEPGRVHDRSLEKLLVQKRRDLGPIQNPVSCKHHERVKPTLKTMLVQRLVHTVNDDVRPLLLDFPTLHLQL